MSQRIDQFCENLRIKLTSIDKKMQQLKAKIDSKAQTAEQGGADTVGRRKKAPRARSH